MITARKDYTYTPTAPKNISTDIDNTSESGGSSVIVEPEIIQSGGSGNTTPIFGNANQPMTQAEIKDISENTPDIKTLIDTNPKPKQTSGSNSSNPNAVPSATTDETKNYISGGTTPDSPITVKKPRPNYLIYGIIGLIGLAVVYKLLKK